MSDVCRHTEIFNRMTAVEWRKYFEIGGKVPRFLSIEARSLVTKIMAEKLKRYPPAFLKQRH